MPTRPVLDQAAIHAVLEPVLGWLDAGPDVVAAPVQPPRTVLAAAVRVTLRALAQRAPGRAVEVRVPPFAAVQCLSGSTHTRGTPPHVVQTDARHWLALATGRLTWSSAVAEGVVCTSGHRAGEVGGLLPLVRLPRAHNKP